MNTQTGFDFKVPYDPRQIAPFAFAAYLTSFDVLTLEYLPACFYTMARCSSRPDAYMFISKYLSFMTVRYERANDILE